MFLSILLQPLLQKAGEELADPIIKSIKKSFFDEDNSGEIEADEVSSLLQYIEMGASLISYAVYADGKLSKEEKRNIESWISALFDGADGDKPLLSDDVLKLIGASRTEIETELHAIISNPRNMAEIVEYAKSKGLQTLFYEMACGLIYSNPTVSDDELEFLADLAEELNLSKIDKKRIERNILSEAK